MEKRRWALRARRPSRATGRPRPKRRRQRSYNSPFGAGFHQPPVPRRLPGQRATSRATACVRAGAERLGVNTPMRGRRGPPPAMGTERVLGPRFCDWARWEQCSFAPSTP